jgi:hypothetical protein
LQLEKLRFGTNGLGQDGSFDWHINRCSQNCRSLGVSVAQQEEKA